MADFDEDEGAERAREFRIAINRKRPSRGRYTLTRQSQSAFEDESNITASGISISNSAEAVPLQAIGGEPLYRDVNETGSLSRLRNGVRKIIPQPIRKALLPPRNGAECRKFFFVHLPILHWLWSYRSKQLIGDLISGLTIGVTHIPQGIGFALLANLPPVYGLYSSFIPVILYSIFGTSRHISVGTFPVVALMAGNAITRLTHGVSYCSDDNSTVNASNTSDMISDQLNMTADPCLDSQCDALKVDIAIALSLLVGILMIAMSLLRLGFITLFLSDALVSGYTAAAAFTVFITQLRFLFGLNGEEAAVSAGIAATPRRFIKYCELIFTGHVNIAAIITAAISIGILISLDKVNSLLRRYIPAIPIHIPAQLIVVILTAGISYGAKLSDRFGLPVINDVGGIPPGKCFGVTLPKGGYFGDLISDAIVIAIIGFVINISQAKLLAKKNAYSIHPDQEFFAYGVMNLGGAFFGSFPTAGALSRTVLQDATGGNTQLVGFISSGIVIVVILFLGSLFGPLPNAALAAIVVVALKGLYFQVRDTYKFFKLSWPDMCVWLIVFLSTLLIGLDVGLGVGVLFSLLVVVVRTILPFSPELGETRAWHYPPDEKLKEEEYDAEDFKVFRIHGVYIFQFNAPLYFANSGVFLSRLHIETGINPGELSASALGCFQNCYVKAKTKTEMKSPGDTEENSTPYVRLRDGTFASSDDMDEHRPSDMKGLLSQHPTNRYHTIVIDCAPIGFVDSMGMATLEQTVREYDSLGIQVLLVSPSTPLCKALQRYGFFNRYSSDHLFPSLSSALRFIKDGNRVSVLEQTEQDISLASNLERQLLYTARPSLLESKIIELDIRAKSSTVSEPVIPNTETTV